MKLKKKVKKSISQKQKRAKKSFFVPAPVVAAAVPATEKNIFWSERVPLFAALFFFSFGMGLITDGKKMYNHQLKLSQRVDYKATLNPYSPN